VQRRLPAHDRIEARLGLGARSDHIWLRSGTTSVLGSSTCSALAKQRGTSSYASISNVVILRRNLPYIFLFAADGRSRRHRRDALCRERGDATRLRRASACEIARSGRQAGWRPNPRGGHGGVRVLYLGRLSGPSVVLAYLCEEANAAPNLAAFHGLQKSNPLTAISYWLGNRRIYHRSATPFYDVVQIATPRGQEGLSGEGSRSRARHADRGRRRTRPLGFMVAGLNPHRTLDQSYRGSSNS